MLTNVTTPQELDERFRAQLAGLTATTVIRDIDGPVRDGSTLTGGQARALYDAQSASRHLDLAARWLKSFDAGYYTIGSSGHEGNAAVALALRPTDPALLHYRSGGFYCARAAQLGGTDPIRDVLRGVVASAKEPIAGGRHKVFGHPDLHIVPTTSTIASHLPRAVGIAYALGRGRRRNPPAGNGYGWPPDAIVTASFGDASINHAAATAAFNTAGWCDHTGLRLPLLLVCEDNGIGISVRSPAGWVEAALRSRPGLRYFTADGLDVAESYDVALEASRWVRRHRRPAVLHLSMVRLMGHAGADAEIGYRTPAEISADVANDPLVRTARLIVDAGLASPAELMARYDELGWEVRRVAEEVLSEPKLASAAEVTATLAPRRPVRVSRAVADAAARISEEGPADDDEFAVDEFADDPAVDGSADDAAVDGSADDPSAGGFGDDPGVDGSADDPAVEEFAVDGERPDALDAAEEAYHSGFDEPALVPAPRSPSAVDDPIDQAFASASAVVEAADVTGAPDAADRDTARGAPHDHGGPADVDPDHADSDPDAADRDRAGRDDVERDRADRVQPETGGAGVGDAGKGSEQRSGDAERPGDDVRSGGERVRRTYEDEDAVPDPYVTEHFSAPAERPSAASGPGSGSGGRHALSEDWPEPAARPVPAQRTPDQRSPDQQAADQRSPEQRATERQASEQPVSDRRASEPPAPEQRAPERSASGRPAMPTSGGPSEPAIAPPPRRIPGAALAAAQAASAVPEQPQAGDPGRQPRADDPRQPHSGDPDQQHSGDQSRLHSGDPGQQRSGGPVQQRDGGRGEGGRGQALAGTPAKGDTRAADRAPASRDEAFAGRLPEFAGPLTLAQTINAALTDAMLAYPQMIVFGEDVAAKGGVYGVTKGLQGRFPAPRVFDTLLDETSILGLALGTGLAGLLPVPEIQYLAYLHNAEDQLRGEAATLQFFSQGAYHNPMVVRVAGLAYQSGFGGHFHNDNALAVLRDVPGLVVAAPARAEDAAPMLRTCLASAIVDGSVCVFLEPIALYHTRDLHSEGDQRWLGRYAAPEQWAALHVPIGRARTYSTGPSEDLTILTFGNGVRLSLRAAARLAADGIGARVVDLRWLSPLPVADIIREATATGRVLIVDETRRSGGVGEGIIAALVDAGYVGVARRVAAVDSFIPLGPAAAHVLVSEEQIVQGARSLLAR